MLSAKDCKQLLEIIEIIHSGQDRAAVFQAMCEKLEKLIGISTAVFLSMDAETGHFLFKDHLRFHMSATPPFLFTVYYAPLFPAVASGDLQLSMRTYKVTDYMSAVRMADTEFGHDFMPLVPYSYDLSASLRMQGDLIGGIGIHRQRRDGDFTERHREIMNVLLPHLARAFYQIDLVEALTSSQTAGVIVLSVAGQPLLMNEEARRALNGRPVSSIPDPGLGPDPAFLRTETGIYRIRTQPVRLGRKEKIIYLEPQPTDRDLQAKLSEYAVSAREQEVVLQVIRGLSNREIADRLCIAEQTVKDHLQAVFEKMKIRRRSELAALLLGLRSAEPRE